MNALSIRVERGDYEVDDRVRINDILLTPKQAREFADVLREFADSADPDVPYVKVPLEWVLQYRGRSTTLAPASEHRNREKE
jgi:hypothetical protein